MLLLVMVFITATETLTKQIYNQLSITNAVKGTNRMKIMAKPGRTFVKVESNKTTLRTQLSSGFKIKPYQMSKPSQVVVAHTFNPSIQETEAGRSLCSRSAWVTEQVPGQPWLHSETLSQKNKTKQ